MQSGATPIYYQSLIIGGKCSETMKGLRCGPEYVTGKTCQDSKGIEPKCFLSTYCVRRCFKDHLN